jgi:predicted negative regulator of RcsB-dependent stress response
MGKFKKQIKDFWDNNREDIILGIIMFLLVALSFAIGMILGSRYYENQAININCPPEFWQEN